MAAGNKATPRYTNRRGIGRKIQINRERRRKRESETEINLAILEVYVSTFDL